MREQNAFIIAKFYETEMLNFGKPNFTKFMRPLDAHF